MTTIERVFQLIEENNFTAKEFADIVGLSAGNITDWKTGRAKPSIESLKKISSSFNVNIEWLLGENVKKERENIDGYLKIPNDFKYYVEDLPEYVVFRIKYITHIMLITSNKFEDIEKDISINMSVYKIPNRFKKDSKRAILYLYNYNLSTIIKSNLYDITEDRGELTAQEKTLTHTTTKIDLPLDFFICPVYGRIAAGEPNWAEECIEGYLPIDPNLMNIVNPEECFFLKVNGESMNKVIKNGAFALIRKQDIVENGEIAAVLVNGYDATLKKFTKNNDVVVLEPMSDDPSFQTQIYDKNTPIKIIGKYIGKFEMNN